MNLAAAIKVLREEGYIEGELSVDPLWYIIWEPENLEEYNKEYELAEYLPGYTAFGQNPESGDSIPISLPEAERFDK